MKPSHIVMGGAAALTLAGAAVVAVAQPAPQPAPNAPMVRQERQIIVRDGRGVPDRLEMRRGGQRGDRLMMRRSPEDRAERLRTLLQLTPAQERALQAFVAATAPPQRGAMQPAVARAEPQTAVERADRMAELTARMAAETKARADATRAFYAALTPSQRKVFDTTAGAGGPVMRIRRMRGDGLPPLPPAPPAPPAPPRAG